MLSADACASAFLGISQTQSEHSKLCFTPRLMSRQPSEPEKDNLRMEFRLGDSCVGGMLRSGNRGKGKTFQVLHILEDSGEASSSVKRARHLRNLIVGISEKFEISY